MTKAQEMTRLAIQSLQEKKGKDLCLIDIREISVLADYFLIASGNNRSQIQAMIDDVEERLGKAGFQPRNIEGYQTGNWVLMDYNDLIVHVFDKQNRLFYDLERIWSDGKRIDVESFLSEGL